MLEENPNEIKKIKVGDITFIPSQIRTDIYTSVFGLFYTPWKIGIYLLILYAYPALIRIALVFYFNRLDLLNYVFMELFSYALIILIGMIFTRLARYGLEGIDDLFNPFGDKSYEMERLFITREKYLRISANLYKFTFNVKKIVIFLITILIPSIIIIINGFFETSGILISNQTFNWFPFDIISYIILNIAHILFFSYIAIILFILVNALIKFFKLKDYEEDFTITHYNNYLSKLLVDEETDKGEVRDILRKSYFDFQKGYRNCGILMFNFTLMLILISLLLAFGPFFFSFLIPEFREQATFFAYIGLTVSIFSSFVFIIPQFGIHYVLSNKKKEIIDTFNQKREILESFYLDAIQNDKFLHSKQSWSSREEILKDIDFLKQKIEKTEKYGTWAYDFPAVLKILAVILSTLLPLILPFLGLG